MFGGGYWGFEFVLQMWMLASCGAANAGRLASFCPTNADATLHPTGPAEGDMNCCMLITGRIMAYTHSGACSDGRSLCKLRRRSLSPSATRAE